MFGGIPALFLTARDEEEEEMIKAFDFGADDCSKAFFHGCAVETY